MDGPGPKGDKPQPDEQDEAIAAMSPQERQAACQDALEDLIEIAAAAKEKADDKADDKAEPSAIRPLVEPVGEAPADYSRYRKLDRFARALAIIEQYYVRPVDGEQLIDGALAGLVADLDPHTIYLPPQEAKMLLEDTEGRFGGVGLIVTLRTEPVLAKDDAKTAGPEQGETEAGPDGEPDGKDAEREVARRLVLHIDDVIPGGPAEAAGLKVGDRILAIEDQPIAQFGDLLEAVTIMRGTPGTQVSFTYVHDEQAEKTITVTRAVVDPPAVEVRWLGEGLGVLRLRDFQEASSRELRDGIDELKARAKQEGQELQGLVLDLRDNGGGLLDQAIAIVDIFVADFVIRSPLALDKAGRWRRSKAEYVGRAGWTLVAGLARDAAIADEVFVACLAEIRRGIRSAANRKREAMNTALIAIGCHRQ
ncbi:MAG: PDZ domain-containing protein, partial [Myxococcales bacterium]|nr:PDZ domain-containing protein [Myxococcales bacterium]